MSNSRNNSSANTKAPFTPATMLLEVPIVYYEILDLATRGQAAAIVPLIESVIQVTQNASSELSEMLFPVRWKYGTVYIDRTPHGYCVTSERGTVWNMLGGWDVPPQPSNRDTDWYKEHNLSNLEAILHAAQAANEAEGGAQ